MWRMWARNMPYWLSSIRPLRRWRGLRARAGNAASTLGIGVDGEGEVEMEEVTSVRKGVVQRFVDGME